MVAGATSRVIVPPSNLEAETVAMGSWTPIQEARSKAQDTSSKAAPYPQYCSVWISRPVHHKSMFTLLTQVHQEPSPRSDRDEQPATGCARGPSGVSRWMAALVVPAPTTQLRGDPPSQGWG